MKLWKFEKENAFPDDWGLLVVRAETKEAALALLASVKFGNPNVDLNKGWTVDEISLQGEPEIVAER